MPRRLLRDRQVVADDWRYAEEFGGVGFGGATGAVHTGAVPAQVVPKDAAVILGFDQWLRERDSWIERGMRLGVVLLPEHKAEQLSPDLARLSLVACSFPGPAEGRGYTQARLLRERHDFRGELRAVGYVHIDQLFFLARCGFNSFELADHELAGAAAAFTTFTAAYQAANDRGLAAKLEISRV
jgi:uncharacterized protein (DUF934 family)